MAVAKKTCRRRRGDRPFVQPTEARAVMDKLFDWLDLGGQAKSFRAVEAFRRAAGPKLASRAQAIGVRGSVLTVRVASAAWSLELSMMEKELVARLNQMPGGEGIHSLRFTVGAMTGPEAHDEAMYPTILPPTRVPPVVDLVELMRALGEVEDRELRENLARLVTRVCTPS